MLQQDKTKLGWARGELKNILYIVWTFVNHFILINDGKPQHYWWPRRDKNYVIYEDGKELSILIYRLKPVAYLLYQSTSQHTIIIANNICGSLLI